MAGFGAAIDLRQHGPQEAHLAHLGHDRAVKGLVAEGGDHAWQQGIAGIGARRVLNHPLVVGQAAAQVKGVLPTEGLLRSLGAVSHDLFLPFQRVRVTNHRASLMKRDNKTPVVRPRLGQNTGPG